MTTQLFVVRSAGVSSPIPGANYRTKGEAKSKRDKLHTQAGGVLPYYQEGVSESIPKFVVTPGKDHWKY